MLKCFLYQKKSGEISPWKVTPYKSLQAMHQPCTIHARSMHQPCSLGLTPQMLHILLKHIPLLPQAFLRHGMSQNTQTECQRSCSVCNKLSVYLNLIRISAIWDHLWRLPPECLAIWRWTWSRGQAIKQGVKQHVKQHVRPKKRTPKKQIQEIEEDWRNRSRHFRTLLDFIGIVSFKFGANPSQCWYLGKSVYTPPPNHSWKQILPVPDSSSIFVISFSTKQLQRCAWDRRAAAQIAKKMPRIKIEISANVERRKTGRDIPINVLGSPCQSIWECDPLPVVKTAQSSQRHSLFQHWVNWVFGLA